MLTPQNLSLIHLVIPPRVEPAVGEKPPLLVLLHGVRSNERDLAGLADYLDPRFVTVSVRSPLTLGYDQYGWYDISFTAEGVRADETPAIEGKAKLSRFLDEAIEAYGTDPGRVYIGGFSQGAIMSLYLALTEPEKVTGTIILSGRLLPMVMNEVASIEVLQGKPFFVAHGISDPVLTIAQGRQVRDFLQSLPVALTYHEYPMGHTISEETLADLQNWLVP